MISKIYTAAAVIALSVFASCAGNKDKDYVDKSLIPAGSNNAGDQTVAPGTANQDPNAMPGNPVVLPGSNTTPINLGPQQNAMQVTPSGINPPHGQPGHRCDIADGAPLNSKPAAPVTAQPATTQQPAISMKEVPNTTKTAPGMNPPHGEPGHRCDISVGEPLNSKPPPPASVVSTTPPPATPITASQPAAQKTVTAPGMNPPHGEPGHRCDISVGQPLNSKPAATTPKEAAPPPLLLPPAKSGGK